jgi:hypothetical protein
MHGSELEARSGDIPVDYNKLCKRWSESAPEHERHGDSYSSARLFAQASFGQALTSLSLP